jgi:hypothetical protein
VVSAGIASGLHLSSETRSTFGATHSIQRRSSTGAQLVLQTLDSPEPRAVRRGGGADEIREQLVVAHAERQIT